MKCPKCGAGNSNENKFCTKVDNLANLVNKDGKIICTKFSLAPASELKKYFKKKIEYYPLINYFSDEIGK